MYKLILADDEAIVRNNIARLIPWEECGFELIGCCANGHELLEMVEKSPPDLVITDINMPFINGIKAAGLIKRDFPAVKIIFLTGYDDFSYAQKAIELNVSQYILKPVTSTNIQQALLKIKSMLDEEYKQSRNLDLLKSFYQQNIDIMQNIFLTSLLTSEICEEEVVLKVKQLGLTRLEGSMFQTAVLIEDNFERQSSSGNLDSLAVYNITKEILDKRGIGYAVPIDNRVVILCCVSSGNSFTNTLEEIRSIIERYLNFTVTVGVGSICRKYSEIHISYNEGLSALGYRQTVGKNKVIFITDLEPHRHTPLVYDNGKEARLLESIKENDKDKICRVIGELLPCTAFNLNLESIQSYVIAIVLSIVREACRIGLDTTKLNRIGNINKILELSSIEKISEIITEMSFCLMDLINQHRQSTSLGAIMTAKEYIQKNYSDPDLSVSKVSEYLHLSSSYFRTLFKNEMGMTFVTYLTNLRMEKAKDLILTTGLKNYEIAEKIGYIDPHYFSYCFKKHFNVPPNEMRISLNKS